MLRTLCLLVAMPSWAADIQPTTFDDIVADDGLCSLREAVDAANGDVSSGASAGECAAGAGVDRIILSAGSYVLSSGTDDDANLDGDLDITGDLTIEGAGAGLTLLDGDDTSGVLTVLSGVVEIRDLTITGGRPTRARGTGGGDGAGLLMDGGDVLLEDVEITGNASPGGSNPGGAGAGIAVEDGDRLELRRVHIHGNTSETSGSRAGHGAGIHIEGITEAILTDVHVEDNVCETGSLFGADGCGLYVEDVGSFRADGLVVAGHDAGCRASADGGGIYLASSTVTIVNSSIYDNTADEGGGLYIEDLEDTSLIRNTTIANNTACDDADGMIVYQSNGTSDLTLDHVTVTGNAGEGVVTERSDTAGLLYVSNSILSGNGDDCIDLDLSSLTSLGGNVFGATCAAGTDDVVADDPLLAERWDSDALHLAPTDGSPALDLSSCLDSDGQVLASDASSRARPGPTCEAGAAEVVTCAVGSDDDADGYCDLTLSTSTSGSVLTVQIDNASERVFVLASRTTGQTCRGAVCADLASPFLVGRGLPSANGQLVVTVNMPSVGGTAFLQAVTNAGDTSGVVEVTLP